MSAEHSKDRKERLERRRQRAQAGKDKDENGKPAAERSADAIAAQTASLDEAASALDEAAGALAAQTDRYKAAASDAQEAAEDLRRTVAYAEQERHQWQELGAPKAEVSQSQLLRIAGVSGASAAVLALLLGWMVSGGTSAAPATANDTDAPDTSATASTRADQIERVQALKKQFDAAEAEWWERRCEPLFQKRRFSSRTWRTYCVRALSSQAAEDGQTF